jgi:cell shape-determining protein MreC
MLLLTGPVYFFAQSPYAVSGTVSDITADRQFLLQQRDQLNAQLLEMKEGQLRVHYLQAENTRLRQLLGSKGPIAEPGHYRRNHRCAPGSSACSGDPR